MNTVARLMGRKQLEREVQRRLAMRRMLRRAGGYTFEIDPEVFYLKVVTAPRTEKGTGA